MASTGRTSRAWKLLRAQPNVRYLGAVEPERLPGLYAASDLGLLPYKRTPLLVQSGFPLKALEMAATGVPMASTLLEPLAGLARAIRVTEGPGRLSRRDTHYPWLTQRKRTF